MTESLSLGLGGQAVENKNLKLDLMLLGNKLVTEHGYPPGNRAIGSSWFLNAVIAFTEALNESPPEVRELLAELGYDWPVIDDPSCYDWEDGGLRYAEGDEMTDHEPKDGGRGWNY